METRSKSYGRWSELPLDILSSVFERFSYADFQRAKVVCSNWHLCSRQKSLNKKASPWLILFPEETLFKEEGCVLYNPEEDRVYGTKQDFSGIHFLANSGNWFLVLDSRTKLYIIDLFSGKKIDLPPLESIQGGSYSLKRVGGKVFKERVTWSTSHYIQSAEDLRGVLWIDDTKGEYVVAWCFDVPGNGYIGFCKNGDDHYFEIPTKGNVPKELLGLSDMVLVGYNLYVLTSCENIRLLDLSGQEGFKDVSTESLKVQMPPLSDDESVAKPMLHDGTFSISNTGVSESNIAVKSSGEVLLVRSFLNQKNHRFFLLSEKNPNSDRTKYFNELEVESLGNEGLIHDLGITVPTDHKLGIEPNSIYFTCDDRVRHKQHSCLDICEFNLGTKTLKRFPVLSTLNLKDARWFLPQA